jgi:type II secretory ATPase GspE/PulE/Tfp pilus assembly ATPase PilB-like protein
MERIEHIKNLLQTPNIKFVVSIKEDIERFIEHFKWQIAVCVDEVIEKKDEVQKWISPKTASITTQVKTIEPVETIETASVVINFVNHMILDAWHRRASDIHLQTCPSKNITQIRFRVDGNCHNYMEIPKDFSKEVISHIKILANLDIAEKRLPQDGKIFFKHKGEPVGEMRIATIPVVGGYEDVAIRLLRKDIPYKLDEIGMTEENLNRFKKVIAQPQGLILCVGPTGCGKTTTLHGVLDFLNRPEVNIWTAEDPIELTFPGLRQIEVSDKIGRSYKRMMRAFLRAGPDIIFVGGIRDKESVNMALEAALTGHLVLSTIHTNSAPETITRLLQMEVDPFNFADSLSAVLSQRLVRMLCRDCKEPYHPNKDEFEVLVRHYGEEYFYKDIGITYSPALTLYRKKRLCRVHEDWLSS